MIITIKHLLWASYQIIRCLGFRSLLYNGMRWLASIWQGFETLNGAMDYYTSYRGGYWSIWKINSYATQSLFGTGRNELISLRVSQNQTSLLTHLIKPPNKRPLCFTVKPKSIIWTWPLRWPLRGDMVWYVLPTSSFGMKWLTGRI